MSSTFILSVITPDGAIFEEPVIAVSVPGQEGSLGVLNRHAPMVAKLKDGLVKVRREEGEAYLAIGSGILEVDHHTKCLLLVDYAYLAGNKEEAMARLQHSR
ncbi:MAG: ATP synthase F1 subunit epsilon [Candidatus Omnitrophica bacterium]|nr:ATP synthase F1 subunit epsilon [Candidatus Omnitrophota bacterium]